MNAEVVKIVSFLTFDGHLAEDLKGFYFSSKNRYILEELERITKKNLSIVGRYEKGMGYGKSTKFRCFNRDVCRSLQNLGVPRGSKVKKEFLVPEWIIKEKEFSRQYLQTAFDCEGSIWFENQPKIRFGICKTVPLLNNGLEFTEQLKNMLKKFGVKTSESWLIKANERKDGETTKGIYFKILQGSIQTYAKEIGFSDRFKNERLTSVFNYSKDGIR